MTLWIGHDNDDPLGVDMSLACEAATESIDLINCCFDIINRDVQVNANLARFRLCHCLKYEARLRVTALTQVDPTRFRGPKRSAEQGAPKLSHSFRVNAVDGQSGPDVRHDCHFTPGTQPTSPANGLINIAHAPLIPVRWDAI